MDLLDAICSASKEELKEIDKGIEKEATKAATAAFNEQLVKVEVDRDKNITNELKKMASEQEKINKAEVKTDIVCNDKELSNNFIPEKVIQGDKTSEQVFKEMILKELFKRQDDLLSMEKLEKKEKDLNYQFGILMEKINNFMTSGNKDFCGLAIGIKAWGNIVYNVTQKK